MILNDQSRNMLLTMFFFCICIIYCGTPVNACTATINSISNIPINLQDFDIERRSSFSSESCRELNNHQVCLLTDKPSSSSNQSVVKRDVIFEGDLRTLVTATLSIGELLCFSGTESLSIEQGQIELETVLDWEIQLESAKYNIGLTYLYDALYNIVWETRGVCDCPFGTNMCHPTTNLCGHSVCHNTNSLGSNNQNCVVRLGGVENCLSTFVRSYETVKVYRLEPTNNLLTGWSVSRSQDDEITDVHFSNIVPGMTQTISGITLSLSGLFNYDLRLPKYLVQKGTRNYLLDTINLAGQYDPNKIGFIKMAGNTFDWSPAALASALLYSGSQCESGFLNTLHITNNLVDPVLDASNDISTFSQNTLRITRNVGILAVDIRDSAARAQVSLQLDTQFLLYRYFFAQVSDADCRDLITNIPNTYRLNCYMFNGTASTFSPVDVYQGDTFLFSRSFTVQPNQNTTFFLDMPRDSINRIYKICFYFTGLGKRCQNFTITESAGLIIVGFQNGTVTSDIPLIIPPIKPDILDSIAFWRSLFWRPTNPWMYVFIASLLVLVSLIILLVLYIRYKRSAKGGDNFFLPFREAPKENVPLDDLSRPSKSLHSNFREINLDSS